MRARILLIGAEAGKLSGLLVTENFEIEIADVEAGLAKASSETFNLIIMGAAPALCGEYRAVGVDTALLMLTEERVTGLRLGADDCVSGSCDSNELLARVEALLRRAPRTRRSRVAALNIGDVEIDFGSSEAWKSGRPLNLSSKEFRLLQYLVDHREKVVTREEILRNVWEYDSAVPSRTVDVHIGWLRQKLENNPQEPRYIKTIRCRGYRFDCDDDAPPHLL
jgi:two-component system alkaline phosphatase synthesis response regulator PhoP